MPLATASAALIADIGGTHARFALQGIDGVLSDEVVLPVAAYRHPLAAIDAFLALRRGTSLHAAVLAIAAPVDAVGDAATLTNAGWHFDRTEIADALAISANRVVLINDFSALALALPCLSADELRQVGGSVPSRDAPKALLGAGTGLGVSGLVRSGSGDRWTALTGEGGHATLAAVDAREAAILERARHDFAHVSAERLLCGAGFSLLHTWMAELDGRASVALDAPAIVAEAHAGDPAARQTVDAFCAFLGGVAGNLALTLGAQGGVYIGGGIVPRLGRLFDDSPFRARFEAKGRFADYLAAIPAYVILAPAPALRGAAQALATGGQVTES